MKRMYRMIVMIFLIFVSGCNGIYEMKHQSYITAIGLDLTEDNKINVSLIELSIDPSGQQDSDENNQQGQTINAKVIDTSCTFFPTCFDQLRGELSGRLTLDKVQYVLLGKKLLKSGVKPYFDYFFHVGQLEQTVKLFVTEQKIADFLQNDGGTIITRLIGAIHFHPQVFDIEMWEFAPKIYTKLQSPIISSLSIQEDDVKSNAVYFLKDDKFGMKLPATEGELIHLLVKDKISEATIMLQNEKVAFRIRKYSNNMDVSSKGVDLYVNIKGWVLTGYEGEKQTNLRAIFDLEKEIEKEIRDKLQEIIDHTQSEGIDFMGIGEKFRHKNWDTSEWETQLKELNIRVHVNAKVLSGYGS
ncbi:Ger(x)C family spore germination protein [Oceanobacillus sp. CAU 1775]